MDRSDWSKLEKDIFAGKVKALVIWRLDRLGRNATQLTALFERLREKKVNLISLREGIDLSTPTGRVVANIMASLAQFEVELKSERIIAGQQAARAAGKRWGGSKKGRRLKVTDLHVRTIRELKTAGEPIAAIARTVGLSRPTVYAVLGSNGAVT